MSRAAKGFTLIELMLAMGFLSVLLLGIAMTIIQVGAIYNRGVTLKDVNQASRDISDDILRTTVSAGSITLANDYVQVPTSGAATGGRLCLGSYSYIWNYAKALAVAGAPNTTKYDIPPTGTAPTDPIRFVRVADPKGIYCDLNGIGGIANVNIQGTDVSSAQELLKSGDHELGIHEFRIVPPVASASDTGTRQQLFSIKMTIGTSKISAIDFSGAQPACRLPGDPDSDLMYCDVQSFTIVVRIGK